MESERKLNESGWKDEWRWVKEEKMSGRRITGGMMNGGRKTHHRKRK